jgi:hypothetical protein
MINSNHQKLSLKIAKEYSEAVNPRIDNTMAKSKITKRQQVMINKTLL